MSPFDDSGYIPLRLCFSDDAQLCEFFTSAASGLSHLAQDVDVISASGIRAFREDALSRAESELGERYQSIRLAVSLLCDLVSQGWEVCVTEQDVSIRRPRLEADRYAEKERVRKTLLLARDEQLAELPVRSFIRSMESRRLGPHGWSSVFSLMRDGPQLADALEHVRRYTSPVARLQHLAGIIDPYLQFVTEDARCEWTGLRLGDIWRYFRHTWLNPARSTPGRTMMILVRDRAVEPHPVIGIAALSSSIVQQSVRDRWIGWDRESVLSMLSAQASSSDASWLLRLLEEMSAAIFTDDFISEGVIEPDDLLTPTGEVLSGLRRVGEDERRKHQLHARAIAYKKLQAEDGWAALVRLHLYKSKRALTLADLLAIRKCFQNAGFTEPSADRLRAALCIAPFRQSVGKLVRMAKAARVGINMMDISVAGAVAPYNELIGGKLVSLLLASPEVRSEYSRRYGEMPSVIASGMRGKKVVRKPDLVLLCTTGLFGGGSSQYNRIRVPAQRLGGSQGDVRYLELGETFSFGTFHISQVTMEEMRVYSEQWHNGSDVHGIFGEGVNPKMRKIRESLDRVGFPSDEILRTGSPRTVYVVPLARNFRDVLLGKADVPDYILPSDDAEGTTRRIAEFWRQRWLEGRISRPGVLESLRRHTLTYPVLHGAAVRLPDTDELRDETDQLAFHDSLDETSDPYSNE